MEAKRDSMGFLGYHYYPQAKHFLRPILPDGTPSELVDGKNLIHRKLTLTTVPGFEKLFTAQLGTAGKRRCMGIFPFVDSTGNVYFILCYPEKIYYYKTGDAAPTDITGGMGLTGGNTDYFDAVYFADTSAGYDPWIVLTNGKDAMIKWTGAGNVAVLGGNPPISRFVTSFGGHIVASSVISGGDTYDQRDQRSDVDEAEDWAGGLAGSNDLRQDAGGIMGSIVFGDLRFVFKENSTTLSRATGYDPPFIYDEEEIPIGVSAPRTIIKCWKYDYGFFMGHDLNCYLIRKDGMYEAIGDNITHRLRDYSNDSNLKYSFAFYYPEIDQILLAVPTTDSASNYCDVIFAFDLASYLRTGEKIWSPPIQLGKYISSGAVGKFKASYRIGDLGAVSSDGTIGGLAGTIGGLFMDAAFSQVLFGDKDGYVYKFDSSLGTFDGVAITWELEFKDLRLAMDWAENFRLLEYELLFKNSHDATATANVYLSIDGGNNFDAGQAISVYTATLGDNEETQASVWFDSVAKKFRIKIAGNRRITLLGQRWFGTEEGRY